MKKLEKEVLSILGKAQIIAEKYNEVDIYSLVNSIQRLAIMVEKQSKKTKVMKPNYNELAKQANEYCKCQGFQEQPLSPETLVMLIITEVAELIEADRKDKRVDFLKLSSQALTILNHYPNNNFKYYYEAFIKGSREDEMSDIMIRLLSMIGYFECKIDVFKFDHSENIIDSIVDTAFYFTKELIAITEIIKHSEYGANWYILISFIEQWAEKLNIDLWYFVDLKMKYNELRPYKHNKKY